MDRLGPFMEELGLLILRSTGEPLKVSLHESDVGGSFLEDEFSINIQGGLEGGETEAQ